MKKVLSLALSMLVAFALVGCSSQSNGKKELLIGAQVIDAIYQGEVHINVHNVSNKTQTIEFGQKLAQAIQKEYRDTEWEEITNEEYNNIDKSSRGDGGFGSTGLK